MILVNTCLAVERFGMDPTRSEYGRKSERSVLTRIRNV